MGARLRRGRGAWRPAGAFVGRRARRAPRPRRHHGRRSAAGLYTNLITSAVGITDRTLGALAEAGLDHVQISIQDSGAASADHIAGYDGAFARKRAFAAEVVRHRLPLTVNAVVCTITARDAAGLCSRRDSHYADAASAASAARPVRHQAQLLRLARVLEEMGGRTFPSSLAKIRKVMARIEAWPISRETNGLTNQNGPQLRTQKPARSAAR